jgi:hypothetical protein
MRAQESGRSQNASQTDTRVHGLHVAVEGDPAGVPGSLPPSGTPDETWVYNFVQLTR